MRIRAIAVTYNNIDLSGDLVVEGAFSEITRHVRMLNNHDPSSEIGHWERIIETPIGLVCEGVITDDALVKHLSRDRAEDTIGLSIGYKTKKARRVNGVRKIFKADLWEISLAVMPIDPKARIVSIDKEAA